MGRGDFISRETIHQLVGDRVHVGKLRRVADVRDLLTHLAPQEPQIADSLLAGHVYVAVTAAFLLIFQMSHGCPKKRRVVAAAQTAMTGQPNKRRPCRGRLGLHQGMLSTISDAGEISHQLRETLRIRLGRYRSVERSLEARRGDQLHRPRNLADVANRLATLDDDSCVGHGSVGNVVCRTQPMAAAVSAISLIPSFY